MRWMTCAIILHNLVIDVEGPSSTEFFGNIHTQIKEQEDRGERHKLPVLGSDEGEAKQQILIAELMRYRELWDR